LDIPAPYINLYVTVTHAQITYKLGISAPYQPYNCCKAMPKINAGYFV